MSDRINGAAQQQTPTHFAVPVEVFQDMMALVEEHPIKDQKKLWIALQQCKPLGVQQKETVKTSG